MKHRRASVICLAGLLMLANAAPGAEAQDAAVFPAPRLVTAETRDNPRALADLQKSGKILFEDDFESDASLKHYFEIRGLREGNAKRTNDAKLAHTGTGAMQLTAVARDGRESGAGATGWLGPDVRLKRFDLGVYVHAAAKNNTVWYDDVALSTGYIGPKARKGFTKE